VYSSAPYSTIEWGATVTFYTRLYQRIFRSGLVAMEAEQPLAFRLTQALQQVAEIIQARTDQAFLVPTMSSF